MGKRGPAPKPTLLKLAQGNPGRRLLNLNEPEYPTESVSCPDFLSEEAQAEWERVAPMLTERGLLTAADRAMLVGYCVAWADFQDAERQLAKYGKIVKQGPQLIPSPYVSIKNKALLAMMRFAQQFGFSPSSRSGIVVTKRVSSDPIVQRKLQILYGNRSK